MARRGSTTELAALLASLDLSASPDQVREGVALLQETSRTAQRVLGGAHPTSKQLVASIEAGQQILAGVVVFAPTSGLLSYSRRG